MIRKKYLILVIAALSIVTWANYVQGQGHFSSIRHISQEVSNSKTQKEECTASKKSQDFFKNASKETFAGPNDSTYSDSLNGTWHFNPIYSLNIPEMCAGNVYTLTVGFDTTDNVVLQTNENSKMVVDTVFLPDGVECDPYGCSYISSVTFTNYAPTTRIQSVDDIYYLRLNMEHSYAGDLYIKLTCPNGQEATILNFGGRPDSPCAADIPVSHMHWNNNYPSVDGVHTATFFGQTSRTDDISDLCNPNLTDNSPEIGWNYCWSSNTDQNYTYAPYDGLIYRSSNVINFFCSTPTAGTGGLCQTFDSSDVVNKTQFYHPEESFQSLVGCPMNGDWSIEVIDGFSQDNGYLFEWELTLAPEISEEAVFALDSFHIVGPWVEDIDSTTFTITPPNNLSSDTIITYTVLIYDTAGGVHDTTFQVHIWPNSITTFYDEVCTGSNYSNYGFSLDIPEDAVATDTILTRTYSTVQGCDSIINLNLTIKQTTTGIDEQSSCDSFTWINGHTYIESTDTPTYTLSNAAGCDSVVTLHLTVWPTNYTNDTDTACGSHVWNGVEYTQSGDYTQTFTNVYGCDSVVTLHLTVWPTNYINDTAEVCGSYGWNDVEYTQSGDYTQTLTNVHGCDSVVTLHLTVWPTNYTNETDTACGSHVWNGVEYTQSGDYMQTLTNVYGCDSVVTLHLTVWPTNYTNEADTACGSHIWNGVEYTQSGNYTQTLTNVHGCDSVVTLHLTIWPTSHADSTSFTVSACGSLIWNGMEYTESGDYTQTFSSIDGCDSVVTMHLSINNGTFQSFTDSACISYTWHNQIYTQTGNYCYFYTNEYGCASTDTLHLTIINPATYTIESSRTNCSDSLVDLSVAGNPSNFIWSTGATTPTITVPRPGTYSVTTSDQYGCQASDTITLGWRENPIFALNIPDLCAGQTFSFNIDYDTTASIVLRSNVSSLAVNDKVFLPDGTYCEPYGCSYKSPVTFTDFSPNARIQSANDIYFLRLNIEHSFAQDIYINLTCPNGQKADILKYGGSGNSECNSSIPPSSRDWLSGSNAPGSSYFGQANDELYSYFECDPRFHPSGIGWNYCWSNNSNQGFQYAPGQGSLVYRSVNAHNGKLDSSNVANRSHFYHPDESFNSLIGCPMNGTWYIEVMDGWSQDNGYIFGWELSLAPELHPDNLFVLDTFDITGPWVTPNSSSSFNITPPATLTHDTTVTYIVTIYDSEGCSFDTVIHVNIWVPRDTLIDMNICSGTALIFPGFAFLAPETDTPMDTILSRTIQSASGCDSTIRLHISVLPKYHVSDTLRLYSNQLPTTHNGYSIPADAPSISTFDAHLPTINDCDSLVTTVVIVTGPDTVRLDSVVCINEMPITWNGITFHQDSIAVTIARTASGQDSITIMTLFVVTNPFVSIDVDSILCAGDTLDVSIGYQPTASAVLRSPTASHQESQKIFLPDGMSCQPYGLYYRSYATFSDFIPGATITSPNDILYLRLKIEHSAIEDLRVTLVCPNGTTCKVVPDEDYDGWAPVPHNYYRINLGQANRLTDQLTCDSTQNPIGNPWNYIWSSNTNHGYTYAPGTYSYCYESVNIHPTYNPYWDNSNGNLPPHQSYIIDSSNLANMTQIYKPQQNFSTLTGCPLNGDWYVQIQDLQEEDNGYLAEWELAIDPSLLKQTPPSITSRNLIGPWVNRTSDSTFFISSPATLSHDTLVSYTIIVQDSLGCEFDTSFDVHFYANPHTTLFDTLCKTAIPSSYAQLLPPAPAAVDTVIFLHLSSIHGCDSLVEYHLHVNPDDSTSVQQYVCGSQLPYQWDGQLFTTPGTQISTLTNHNGCDSIVTMTLLLYDNDTTRIDSTICASSLPLTWNGHTFSASGTASSTLTNINGCDSLVLMTLHVADTSNSSVRIEIPENDLPYTFLGTTFTNDTANVIFNLQNANGCDSIITFSLTVHRNSEQTIDSTICDYELPFFWNGHMLSFNTTLTVTLHDQFGADSIVTLNLTIIPTDITINCLTSDFCENNVAVLEVVTSMENYVWSYLEETSNSITVYTPGTYSVTGTQGECSAQASYHVEACTYNLFLPNSITPGYGDGLNDFFFIPEAYMPQIADQNFEIRIYNRWGDLVFLSQDKHFKWDGTVNGVLYRDITYNYVIRYSNIFGKPDLIKGTLIVF